MLAMSRRMLMLAVFTLAGLPALAQLHQYKPGFNLFSRDQDVQLGKEAAGEIEKQAEVVDNKELTAYINSIGSKLAAQPQADKYPYTFKVVNDKSINAFALPGGPAFVHTGLIAAVDNEAQLAGVLAHEITHVALRHGTNQASRANLIQLPAMLAGTALGTDSMLGKLGQIGIGLGANSVLLKFSRTAETQADLVGAQIAAQAGYNPIEMARFFQKLEAEGGTRGPQFFSDHPNPGNRMKAIEDEIRYMPQRNYGAETGQLARMKAIVAKLPSPKKKPRAGCRAAIRNFGLSVDSEQQALRPHAAVQRQGIQPLLSRQLEALYSPGLSGCHDRPARRYSGVGGGGGGLWRGRELLQAKTDECQPAAGDG